MKPFCRASLYSGFIACLMVLTACSGGAGGGGSSGSSSDGSSGGNAAPAAASPEGSTPEIGITTGAQDPTVAPPAAGIGQPENTPAGITLGTTGTSPAPVQGTPKTKTQDGVLIKGTWQKQSSLQPARRSLITMIGEFFIGTAYAENLGTGVHFRDIIPGSSGGLVVLTDAPGNTGAVQILTAKDGVPVSQWKKSTLTLSQYNDLYEYHRARLISDPGVNTNYLTWMGAGGMAALHLAKLVTDSYGNISKTDLAPLSSYTSSTTADYSLLDDATIHQTPNGTIAAVAVSLNNMTSSGMFSFDGAKLAAGAYKCEPTVIGVYKTKSSAWETKKIPCHAGMEDKKYSAVHTSVEFDANSNLIVFQTSNTSPTSYYLTGYKFPYDAYGNTLGDISTLSDLEVKDSPDGLMKFVADDEGNGYVLGFFKGALLTDKMIDVQVPAECTEEGAKPSYFYFMDTCFKTKAVQQKGNQLVVYRYNSQDNTFAPIDAIPLLGWMGNWDKHNYSATFDHGSKKFVIGVNQEDTTYPSVLARYDGKTPPEYLDISGLPLGSDEFYLASSNDAVAVGMWAMAQIPLTCNASGICTSGSYAPGSTIYKFSPDIPVAATYGSPICTNATPNCSGGNTTGILVCDNYGTPTCGSASVVSFYKPVCDSYSVKCEPNSMPPVPVEPYNPPPPIADACANNPNAKYGNCCVGTKPTCADPGYGNVICNALSLVPTCGGTDSGLPPTCPVPDGPVKCW